MFIIPLHATFEVKVEKMGFSRRKDLWVPIKYVPGRRAASLLRPNYQKCQLHHREKDSDGRVIIDRDPATFKIILRYLRTGEVVLQDGVSQQQFEMEMDYYGFVMPSPRPLDETEGDSALAAAAATTERRRDQLHGFVDESVRAAEDVFEECHSTLWFDIWSSARKGQLSTRPLDVMVPDPHTGQAGRTVYRSVRERLEMRSTGQVGYLSPLLVVSFAGRLHKEFHELLLVRYDPNTALIELDWSREVAFRVWHTIDKRPWNNAGEAFLNQLLGKKPNE